MAQRQKKRTTGHRNSGARPLPRGIQLVRLQAVQDTLRLLWQMDQGTLELQPSGLRTVAKALQLPFLALYAADDGAHVTPADLRALDQWCAAEEVGRDAALRKGA